MIKRSLTGAERLARVPPLPGVTKDGVVVGGEDGARVAPKPVKLKFSDGIRTYFAKLRDFAPQSEGESRSLGKTFFAALCRWRICLPFY